MYRIEGMPHPVEEIRILTLPQSYVRQIHENITLPCATHHAGGTVVTWSKDDQVLSADNVKVLKDKRILLEHQLRRGVNISIVNLRGEDSGLYKCTLNFNKKALHVEHKLQVEVAPSIHFLQPSSKIVVRSGSHVRLECRASGHPPPLIRWSRQHNQPFPMKQGNQLFPLKQGIQAFSREPGVKTLPIEPGNQPFPMEPENQLDRQGEVINLRNVTRVYSGEYICKASNGVGHGAVRETVTLEVLYPPVVKIDTTWKHAAEGDTVDFQCKVEANPVPKVVWYKDTMKLMESSRLHIHHVGSSYKLNIKDLEIGDWGQYYCGAANKLGESSVQVTLTGAPAKPDIL